MKKMMIIIFLILFSNLFQVHLHSVIRSRIEGTFWDKDNGEPLEGVEVTLFKKGPVELFPNFGEKTDKNGRFVFDQITNGEYIIMGEKPGYVPYQPMYKIVQAYRRKLAEIIRIGEGEIRHFDIQMERGGQLLAKIFKKDENGISPYTRFSAQIGFRASEKIEDIFTLSGIRNGGEYFADGLVESDRYTLSVSAIEREGYPDFETNFEIKKGEITTIEHTFDFTDNTGVTGVIYLDNEPIKIAIVTLEDINSHAVAQTETRIEYKYSFKNIVPGLYTLRVYFDKDDREYRVSKKIFIEKEILKKFDLRIKKGPGKLKSFLGLDIFFLMEYFITLRELKCFMSFGYYKMMKSML